MERKVKAESSEFDWALDEDREEKILSYYM